MKPPVPEFNWLPPVWDTTEPDLKTDPNNSEDDPKFEHGHTTLHGASLLEDRINALKAKFQGKIPHVHATRAVELQPHTDPSPNFSMVPHPYSDFSHVDPGVYTDADKAQVRASVQALKDLKDKSQQDPDAGTTFNQALPSLDKMEELFADQPKGMRRLKRVFENVLVEITALLGEMNAALQDKDPVAGREAYRKARKDYIELIDDLDNREPKTIVPGKRGYGRILQWVYIKPLITKGVIKGAKFVAKWNPHLSSSGIPIPHS